MGNVWSLLRTVVCCMPPKARGYINLYTYSDRNVRSDLKEYYEHTPLFVPPSELRKAPSEENIEI